METRFNLRLDEPEVLNIRGGNLKFEKVEGLDFWFTAFYNEGEQTQNNGRCVVLSESLREGYVREAAVTYDGRIYILSREPMRQVSKMYLNLKTPTAVSLPKHSEILGFHIEVNEIAMYFIGDLWDRQESCVFMPALCNDIVPLDFQFVGTVSSRQVPTIVEPKIFMFKVIK